MAESQSGAEDVRQGYLARAQDSLHMAVDRLAGDARNPLNAEVEQALERVEGALEESSFVYTSGGLGSEASQWLIAARGL